VLVGYNMMSFDLPYLLKRAELHGVKEFPYLGRIKTEASTVKVSHAVIC